jgi:hypothetical protein
MAASFYALRSARLHGVVVEGEHLSQGGAVQVEPMKTRLKPAGTKRLKVQYDEPPSIVAFNVNLRRYIKGRSVAIIGDSNVVGMPLSWLLRDAGASSVTLLHTGGVKFLKELAAEARRSGGAGVCAAGSHTRPLLSPN